MDSDDLSERHCREKVLLSVPQELSMEGVKNVYLTGLSVYGAEIVCLGEPHRDETLQFYLQLPRGMYTLFIRGEVMWQRKERAWLAGLKFVSLSDVDRQILEAYVDYLKRQNVLIEARKTINMHMEAFIKRLNDCRALMELRAGINETEEKEMKPRYLH